jgi:CRP/FNR family transcriptional regulator, cyclic AMP receptor protein
MHEETRQKDRKYDSLEIRQIKDRQFIFREREIAEFAFLLVSGVVQLIKTKGEEDIVLATLEKGMLFGEIALVDNQNRMVSALAVGPVQVKVIPRDVLDKKMESMDPFARGFIRGLAQQVRGMAKFV